MLPKSCKITIIDEASGKLDWTTAMKSLIELHTIVHFIAHGMLFDSLIRIDKLEGLFENLKVDKTKETEVITGKAEKVKIFP